jgi:protein-S-isoprenylcysteine O-methyltransferase Ste14
MTDTTTMNPSPLADEIKSPAALVSREDEIAGRNDLYLDWLERFLVVGFFCWLVVQLVGNYQSERNVGSLFLLPSEGLVVVFILIRRPSRVMSRQPGAWMMAIAATCAPMLVTSVADQNLVPAAVGAVVLLMGIIIQMHAKITLGRSLGCVAAHRGLILGGPYRFVRHPMYAGYLLSHLAFLALNPCWWNLGVYCFCYGLQIPRLFLEERLLSSDPSYRTYQSKVRFRLIPGVF